MASGPVTASPEPDQSVVIRLQDGSRWRGEVGDVVKLTLLDRNIKTQFTGRLLKAADLYIVVEGSIAGEVRQKTIFRGDIVSMRRADEGSISGAARRRSTGSSTGMALCTLSLSTSRSRSLGNPPVCT